MYYNKKENDLNTILLKAKATGRSNITVHYAHRLYIYIYMYRKKAMTSLPCTLTVAQKTTKLQEMLILIFYLTNSEVCAPKSI